MKLLKKSPTGMAILLIAFIVFANIEAFAEYTANKSKENVPQFVENEILVKFKEGVDIEAINEINKTHGTSVKTDRLAAGYMRLLVNGNDRAIRRVVMEYRNLDEVVFAEPNYIVDIEVIPNDPDFTNLWGLNNIGQTGGTIKADISMNAAWDIRTDGSTIISAVIDTGVDYGHEDLAQNMWINLGEIENNGIDDDGNGFIDDVKGWDFANDDNAPFDDNSHGTHVAGTIAAAGNNGVGVAGVNWAGTIMPLKFLRASGSGSTADAINAIEYATMMGAKVMNNSWGGGGFSQALKDAISAADTAGILFVAAAGNDGTNNETTPHYPSSYDLSNIISVAATDHNDNLATFSNFGVSSVDIGAPGVSVYSTKPDNSYGFKSGTSMAAPHISGISALLMAQFQELSHFDIKDLMLNTVDKLASLTGKVLTDGRLNANKAISGTTPPPAQNPIVILEDNMESGTNGWTVSGPTALWHQSNNRFNSTSTSWYYGIEGAFNYDTGGRNSGALISPPVDLTNVTGATLNFTHFLDTEVFNGFDTAIVSISNNGGATFIDIFSKLTTNNIFVQENLNISMFDGNIITIKFFFDTIDNLINNFEGWYLDDVKVTGVIDQALPTSNAGADQTVTDIDGDGTEPATLDGSSSFDPDGSIISFEWKEGETVLGNEAIITTDFTVGSHSISLTVTDNDGLTDIDIVTVTVNSTQPPVSNAGEDQTANDTDGNGIETITLNGSASFDPDGTIVAYEWKNSGSVIGSESIITSDFQVGIHTVILIVTDNNGAIGTDSVTITVNPNQPPAAIAGDDQILEDTDDNGFETLTLDGTGSFDTDGNISTYKWEEADILLGTSSLIIKDMTVGLHNITLTVTDNGGLINSDALLVTVNPKPSAAPLIYVASIDIQLSKKGPKYRAKVIITILNDNDNTVSGVTVNGDFSLNGSTFKQAFKNTDKKGTASLDSGNLTVTTGDTITFTVTSVVKSGFTYDPESNIETSNFVIIP